MKILNYLSVLLLIFSPLSWGKPKITVTFDKLATGFTQVKIRNDTFESLACYVAIDGFKEKFQLRAKSSSPWITATDKRYNYQNFSTWCDYLETHPSYRNYRAY